MSWSVRGSVMSTPVTLEPLGAVGELERRATIPVMPPNYGGGDRPRKVRGSAPAASGGQRIQVDPVFVIEKVGEKAQEPYVATHGAAKQGPRQPSSFFVHRNFRGGARE